MAMINTYPPHRGTRQGCPLYRGLFTVTLEPLAFHIRATAVVKGIRVGLLEVKLSLYSDSDDDLLYAFSYMINRHV